jgi:hypothetical protein
MQFVRCGKSKVLSVCIFAESGQIGADSFGWIPFFVGLLACSSDIRYRCLLLKVSSTKSCPPSPWLERSESAWACSVLCLH